MPELRRQWEALDDEEYQCRIGKLLIIVELYGDGWRWQSYIEMDDFPSYYQDLGRSTSSFASWWEAALNYEGTLDNASDV